MNPKAALFGVAVGDALGVPVEFQSREKLASNPVTDMQEFGTYNQPKGTWSDDSSLTFCLAEALVDGYSLNRIANKFIQWSQEEIWTPHGSVFDIGRTTREAIMRLMEGEFPKKAGGATEHENGNGSLMRILPLVFYSKEKPIKERFQLAADVSSITHRNIRSQIACFYYLEFARKILEGEQPRTIYQSLQQEITDFLEEKGVHYSEIAHFDRLLNGNIARLTASEINSGGYVIDSLEASIWCLLTTNSYAEAVLKAVNLGRDTDTTGAITGGLAGLVYGFDGIPKEWVDCLARKKDIEALGERMEERY